MKAFFIVALVLAFLACSKPLSDDSETAALTGRWVRSEVYVSPGNGGAWQPANDAAPIYLELTADGKVLSNHPVYQEFRQYTMHGDTAVLTATINGYLREARGLLENNKLTMGYACICGCGDKFVKEERTIK